MAIRARNQQPKTGSTEITTFFAKPTPRSQPLPKAPKASLHPIQQHLKTLDKLLPKVDESGFAHKGNLSTAKEKKTECFQSASALSDHLPRTHCISHPHDRARVHKAGAHWKPLDMKKALQEFCVPEGMKVVIICPELHDRDLLKVDSNFISKCGNGSGPMSPCPKCKSNCHMQIIGWTSQRATCQKVLSDSLFQDLVVGAVHGCANPSTNCLSTKEGTDAKGWKKTRKMLSAFTACSNELWTQFPASTRRRCLDCAQDIDQRETTLMLSPGFADRLQFHDGNFDVFANEMEEAHRRIDQQSVKQCHDFIQDEATKFPSKPMGTATESVHQRFSEIKWPPHSSNGGPKSHFKSPGNHTILKMFKLLRERVEPYLERDLFSRCGGRFLRVDGTFKVVSGKVIW